MVTEQQRQQLLQVLSLTLVDMDQIIEQLEKLHGMKVTPEEILAAVDQLRQVRGC